MTARETRRVQVELDAELAESLDRIARRCGASPEDVLRDAARQLVAAEAPLEDDPIFKIIGMAHSGPTQEKEFDPTQVPPILNLAAIGDSGPTDVSQPHDYYLTERRKSTRLTSTHME